jgi:hypothetical protein
MIINWGPLNIFSKIGLISGLLLLAMGITDFITSKFFRT